MRRFENQVAIVTGGAQGIGLGIARRLGGEGAAVALLDQNAKLVTQEAGSLEADSITAMAVAADVTQQAEVEQAVHQVRERFGRIDVLVTAAGIVGPAHVKTHQVDPAEFDRVFDVNLKGMYLCIRAVLPVMLAADYGRIVNMASISGKDGNPGMLAYSASKAAVINLTKVVGKDYAETGITCNAIAPALIHTAMAEGLPPAQFRQLTDKIPMKRMGEVEEVAAVAAFAASKECSFITGFTFDASGGRAVY